MKLLEITVERAKEAYRKTGLRPGSRRRDPLYGECCIVGALMVEAGRPYLGASKEPPGPDVAFATLGLEGEDQTQLYEYESGFDHGLESGPCYAGLIRKVSFTHYFKAGVEIGAALKGWTP